jgi:hypothetical protein
VKPIYAHSLQRAQFDESMFLQESDDKNDDDLQAGSSRLRPEASESDVDKSDINKSDTNVQVASNVVVTHVQVASNVAPPLFPEEHEERLEYGDNASEIAADNMAATFASIANGAGHKRKTPTDNELPSNSGQKRDSKQSDNGVVVID